MRYVKLTLSYIGRALPVVFVIALVPAAVIAFIAQPVSEVTFLSAFAKTDIQSFYDVYQLIMPLTSWVDALILLGVFVLLVFALSYLLAVVEKHFRTGRLSLAISWSNVSHNLAPVLQCLALIMVSYYVYKFLFVCFVTLITLITGGQGIPSMAAVIISGVAGPLGLCVLIALLLSIVATVGIMLVYGYAFADAVNSAVKLIEKNKWKLRLSLMLPFVVLAGVVYLCLFIPMPGFVLDLIETVLLMFFILYCAVFVLTVIFDLSGIERRDLRRYY